MQDKENLIAELQRRQPFDRMEGDVLQWLGDSFQLVTFPEGAVILAPGKACESLYFIHSGGVQLEAMGDQTEETKVLAELVESESFPVEALHEHRPVFSTFRAKVETVCYALPIDRFEELKRRSKVFADFCRYRSAAFLEQSRRIYRLHFSHQSEEQQRLNVPLSLLMQPKPLTVGPQQPLSTILSAMHERKETAVVVIDGWRQPVGIFTMTDLLRTIITPEFSLETPVGRIMTGLPRTLPVTALGYEAAMLMAETGCQHAVLVNGQCLAGIVYERDLFNLQRVSLGQISGQIRVAQDIAALKHCKQDIDLIAGNMLLQGVTADQITQIISSLNDQVICRTLEIELAAEPELQDVKFCWISLGSEGRFEQTFTTDQDNAIIFEAGGEGPRKVRDLLLPVARRVNSALDAIGFPLCKGNVMAGNPDCCLSYQEWQSRFTAWTKTPTPEALLKATIYFDFRHLYGDTDLSDQLRLWLGRLTKGKDLFLHLLAQNALERTPPIGFFRDFIVEDHAEHPKTIDIKLSGVTLFADAARVYALATGVMRTNTKQRLLSTGDQRKWPQSDVNAWADAFSFLQSLRIRHQFELKQNGSASHNRLDPYALNNLDRKFFLEALRQAGKLQKQLETDFNMSGAM